MQEDIWVMTATRQRKEIEKEAAAMVLRCLGHEIIEISGVNAPFKHGSYWHSHVFYTYQKQAA